MARHLDSNPGSTESPSSREDRRLVQPDLLSYHLLRPREVGPADVPLIGEAYRVWSETWSETFRELDGQTHVPSDQFTRQDEVGAIFHGYECVALSCFRWVDLTLPMTFGDSYFERWPESAREAAMRGGARVCIGNQITVARDWRRVKGVSLSAIVTAMCIERFLHSDADAILGTMRDDRGMDALTKALGAEVLGNAEMHGVPVTLVAVYRGSKREPLDPRNEAVIRKLAATLGGGAS